MPIYFSCLIKALLFARLVVRTISTYRKSGRLFYIACNRLWVLKNSVTRRPLGSGDSCGELFFSSRLSSDLQSRCYRLTEEAHQSLDVLCHRCQEELLAHELQSAQAQAAQSNLILEFREQGFHLFPFPLCLRKLGRVRQLPRPLSGWFVLVDDQSSEGSAGALWSERARAALFACPDVVEGAIPIHAPPIVERLTGGADIAIVFRFVGESLGAKEWAPLSVDTVTGPHIGRDAPIRQPLQELAVPVGRIGRHRFRLSSLPLSETGEHVLRGNGFLTHACGRGLHSHDHTTVIVHQIVVVISQPRRCAALGGVGRIGIGGRIEEFLPVKTSL